jgi:hypothetical protein
VFRAVRMEESILVSTYKLEAKTVD